jgi:UDP-glucose 4-epimerase
MNILVTGGCGFIGSHIVDAYVSLGHRLWVIDDLSTGSIDNLNPQAEFLEMDINSKHVVDVFKKAKIDVINHHAAQINVRTSVQDPAFDARVNILGSLNLLKCAAQYNIKRFIFASSGGAVYGEPEDLPISETCSINPLSPYGIAKATVEKYLMLWAAMHSFDHVILRYSNVYGPRQISKSEAGVISIFIDNINKQTDCVIFGDGNATRDYVYVSDVVKANIAALECNSNIFNIGTSVQTSVNDLVKIMADLLHHPIAHKHTTPRPGEVLSNALDNKQARSGLNWQPSITLKQGIKNTFEYFTQIS